MTATTHDEVKLPPRPAIRVFWALHRFAIRVTGHRFGLRRPKAGATFGMLRLTTVGRRSGRTRTAVVGYVEDGQNLVTLAMNGWGKAEPAWWLNLQANPDAEVVLPDGSHAVRARAAIGEERERLWATFQDFPGWGDDLDGLAARRPGQTAIVVLEPRASGGGRPAVSVVASAASATTAAESDVEVRSAASSSSSFRFRPRYLWVVPGLAVAVYAGFQADARGLGGLVPLVFGLAPHAGVVLGFGGLVAADRFGRSGVAIHNLMHHPLPPVAVVIAGLTGVLSPLWLVGGMAWLGHVVIGWGVGDGAKAHRPSTAGGSRLRRILPRRSAAGTPPEIAA
jgi:deazaflavin-dependent oxidoreductase (nitroreductase family)